MKNALSSKLLKLLTEFDKWKEIKWYCAALIQLILTDLKKGTYNTCMNSPTVLLSWQWNNRGSLSTVVFTVTNWVDQQSSMQGFWQNNILHLTVQIWLPMTSGFSQKLKLIQKDFILSTRLRRTLRQLKMIPIKEIENCVEISVCGLKGTKALST